MEFSVLHTYVCYLCLHGSCVTMLYLVVFILGGHFFGAAMEFFNDDTHIVGAYYLIWRLGGLSYIGIRPATI